MKPGDGRALSGLHRPDLPARVCPTCNARFFGGEEFCPIDGARLNDPAAAAAPAEGARRDPQDSLIGQTIARRFRLTRRIGRGGMGVVYQATHLYLNRPCAVKLLHRRHVNNERILSRFMREARVASALDHPNIVTIYDYGLSEQGEPYLVMEFVEGTPLHRALAAAPGKVLSPGRVVDIAAQVARALCHAHERSVIHRDIKPENILLTEHDGQPDFVKVLDFGLAKITSQPSLTLAGQDVMGTPEFMAPEMIRNPERVAAPVDLYAFGVLLYELCSGQTPFSGPIDQVLVGHLTREPKPLVLPPRPHATDLDLDGEDDDDDEFPELIELVTRLLAKEPEDRPAAPEALAILERLQARRPRRSLRSLLLSQTVLASAASPTSAPAPAPAPAPIPAAPVVPSAASVAPVVSSAAAPSSSPLPSGPPPVADVSTRTAALSAAQTMILPALRGLGDLSRARTVLFRPDAEFLAPDSDRDRVTLLLPEDLRTVDSLESSLGRLRDELLSVLRALSARLLGRAGPFGELAQRVAACDADRRARGDRVAQLERECDADDARVRQARGVLRERLRALQERLKFEKDLPAADRAVLGEECEAVERDYFAVGPDNTLRERLLHERLGLHQLDEALHRAIIAAGRRALLTTWPGGQREDHQRLMSLLTQFENAVSLLEGVSPPPPPRSSQTPTAPLGSPAPPSSTTPTPSQ